MATIKVKTVTWQLKGQQEAPEEGALSSSVLSDASLLCLARALGNGGLSTCMCLGLPTSVVVGVQLSNAGQPAVAVTNSLLRHWKGLKRAETKERDMVRTLEKALRYSGRTAMADILTDRFSENQPLTESCWRRPSSIDVRDF